MKGLSLEKERGQNKNNWKMHKQFSKASIFFSTIAVISILIFPYAYYAEIVGPSVMFNLSIWGDPSISRSFIIVILFAFLCCVLISISWLLLSINKNHLFVNPLRICLVITSFNSFVLAVIFASILLFAPTGDNNIAGYSLGVSPYTSIVCSFILFLVSLIQFKYPVMAINTEPVLEKKNISKNIFSE